MIRATVLEKIGFRITSGLRKRMEYFDQDVWYCGPLRVGSIKASILEAWHARQNKAFQQRILEKFTWPMLLK